MIKICMTVCRHIMAAVLNNACPKLSTNAIGLWSYIDETLNDGHRYMYGYSFGKSDNSKNGDICLNIETKLINNAFMRFG